jgi:hypothetical protein
MPRLLIALCAAALAIPALADTPTPTPEPAKPAKPKLICKTYAETGSWIARRRVCKTAVEWRNEEQDIQTIGDSRACVGDQCAGAPPG